VLGHPLVHEIAARTVRTVPQVIFRFALHVGMIALTGTTSNAHMREDLSVDDFALQPDEIRALDELAT
jgi:diketogulonate reductase-like aldo/keto reductase